MAIRNFAQEAFRSDGDQLLVPRQKYNFELQLFMTGYTPHTFKRVSNTSAASYSIDTTVMNQYNKKRVVQTRLNYDPITVVFYDTYDNHWHHMMKNYLSHYYNNGDGIRLHTGEETSSTVSPSFDTSQGFTPNADRYFFSQIKIIQNGHLDEFRETILINPHITSMQGDTLDYADSETVKYSVTFQPESIQVKDYPRDQVLSNPA